MGISVSYPEQISEQSKVKRSIPIESEKQLSIINDVFIQQQQLQNTVNELNAIIQQPNNKKEINKLQKTQLPNELLKIEKKQSSQLVFCHTGQMKEVSQLTNCSRPIQQPYCYKKIENNQYQIKLLSTHKEEETNVKQIVQDATIKNNDSLIKNEKHSVIANDATNKNFDFTCNAITEVDPLINQTVNINNKQNLGCKEASKNVKSLIIDKKLQNRNRPSLSKLIPF